MDFSARPYSRQRGSMGTPLYTDQPQEPGLARADADEKTGARNPHHPLRGRPATSRRGQKNTSMHLWPETTNAPTEFALFERKRADAAERALVRAEREAEIARRKEEIARREAGGWSSSRATTASSYATGYTTATGTRAGTRAGTRRSTASRFRQR
jgi:hypothetical protein